MAKLKACTQCETIAEPKQYTPGTLALEALLWGAGLVTLPFGVGCLILPVALVYSLWRVGARHDACPSCNSRMIVPVDSPAGRRISVERAK